VKGETFSEIKLGRQISLLERESITLIAFYVLQPALVKPELFLFSLTEKESLKNCSSRDR